MSVPTLGQELDQRLEDLESSVGTLSNALLTEQQDRASVDLQLDIAISTERGDRIAADADVLAAVNAIDDALSAEIAARTAGDTQLTATLDGLDSRVVALEGEIGEDRLPKGGINGSYLIAAGDSPAAAQAQAHAVVDGSTPWGDVIAAALLNHGNSHVLFEFAAGTYAVDEPFILAGADHVVVMAPHEAARFQPTSSFPADRGVFEVGWGDGLSAAYTRNVTLKGINVEGNYAGTAVHGFRLAGYNVKLIDCEAKRMSGWGVIWDSPNMANRTDCRMHGYKIGWNKLGGVLAGHAMTDGYIGEGVIMHSGKDGETEIEADAPGLVIAAAAIAMDKSQIYGNTGFAMEFLTSGAQASFNGMRFETSAGLIKLAKGWNLRFTGCGFRGGSGAMLVADTSDQIKATFNGCTFAVDGGTGTPARLLWARLDNANSLIQFNGGFYSGTFGVEPWNIDGSGRVTFNGFDNPPEV